MPAPAREPLGNMRFRVEIEGARDLGAVEVIFPEARIETGVRGARVVRYGPLLLRRGVTASTEWYDWWDSARQTRRPSPRDVLVTLMERSGADARSWAFTHCLPVAYHLSPLDALGNSILIEMLEVSVSGFEATVAAPRPTRPKRTAPR